MGMKRSTETDLVRTCLDWLRLKKVFAFRVNTTGVRRRDKIGREFWAFNGVPGVSDIIGALPISLMRAKCGITINYEEVVIGRILAVECKATAGRLSPAQALFLVQVNAIGGLGLCVRDLNELRAAVEPLLEGR